MHAVLCAYGTFGNVLPFIGWGRALRMRGHQVTIVGTEFLDPISAREGLDFVRVDEPLLVKPKRGDGLWPHLKYVRTRFDTTLRGFFPALEPLVQQPDTVVAAPYWIMGARMACEKYGAPLATAYLQPRILLDDSPAPLRDRIRRTVMRNMVRPLASKVMGFIMNGYRRELGMPPVSRPFQWWNSPDAVLAFFPEWYSPQQPIWPAHLEHVGFPLYDNWQSPENTEEIDRFFESGDPPLIFSQSSDASADRDFAAVSIEAAKRLNRRAVILTTKPEQLPNPLPSHVRYFGIVPLSMILPRSAAFIHHGGVGSLSQALAAGVPQLTMPKILDQFDNCKWLARLGVSRQLKVREYRVDRVVEELKFLLESSEIQAKCREFASCIPTADPFGQACDSLERLCQVSCPVA